MQTARYFRLALLGATLLSTPVLAATNDQATTPPPANNTAGGDHPRAGAQHGRDDDPGS